MLNYFQPQDFFLDHIWFYHDKSHYHGTGMLRWEPAKGFHIAARVKRSRPYPQQKNYHAISFNRSTFLRMQLADNLWAIAPRVRIDDFALDLNGQLHLDLYWLYFMQPLEREGTLTSWNGSAIIETNTNITLPDPVKNNLTIGDWERGPSFSSSGIYHTDDRGERVIAQLNDKKYLSINWTFPTAHWGKADAWGFGEGFQQALSFLAGEVTQLRHREMYRGTRIITEIRAGYKTASLNLILHPFDEDRIDKDRVMHIASFLARPSKEGDICKKIFQQLADAAEQRTRQAMELLVATILEAAVRSLYNQPFSPEKTWRTDPFTTEKGLKLFHQDYLSDDVTVARKWKKVINEVLDVQKRLRHRNAHPDWLSTLGGALSQNEIEQSTNDLIRLTRFYGYIILALVGIRDLQPIFPAEVKNWNPMMTMVHTNPEQHE